MLDAHFVCTGRQYNGVNGDRTASKSITCIGASLNDFAANIWISGQDPKELRITLIQHIPSFIKFL